MKLPRSLPPGVRHRARGLTLIELMVAMAIGLMVTLAAAAALVAARTGFTAVDAGSQLRENGRFAADMVTRIVAQSGYDDQVLNNSTKQCSSFGNCAARTPDVEGFNNAVFISAGNTFPPTITNGSRTAACGGFSGTDCANGSDVLVVRFQGSSFLGTTAADGSVINCAGGAEPSATQAQLNDYETSRAYAIFHVDTSASGEPALMCSFRNAAGAWETQPLVQGVEGFQVLFGMDYGTVALAATTPGDADSFADRFLRADQIVVAGNVDATRANWRRVAAIRIGLVLRSAPGPGAGTGTRPFVFPFGEGTWDAADVGTRLAVAADRRLRQTVTLTIDVRNRLEHN